MKPFYSIQELANILNEDIYSVADALVASGVTPTRNGKPADLSRWRRPRPARSGETIFINLMAPEPDDHFPNEFIVLASHLPAEWIANIQWHQQSSDEKAVDESALDYQSKLSNKKYWTDDKLNELWQESILPGATHAGLAEKYKVTRQRIGALIAHAKEKFSHTVPSSYGLGSQLKSANARTVKGKRY